MGKWREAENATDEVKEDDGSGVMFDSVMFDIHRWLCNVWGISDSKYAFAFKCPSCTTPPNKFLQDALCPVPSCRV